MSSADLLKLVRMEYLFRFGRNIVWVVGAVAFAYVGIYLPVVATAGKETVFNFVFKTIVNMQLNVAFSWIVSTSTTLLWIRERRLRKTTTARLQSRVVNLETAIDPSRESSGMAPLGNHPIESE